jgi:DtxR family Mn-dependent transcriptional regulator
LQGVVRMSAKRDEYLEALWRLRELDKSSIEDLNVVLDIPFEHAVLDDLVSENMAVFDAAGGTASLTEAGLACARQLVRKHRLAERLLHDVLHVESSAFETEACTFEHLVAPRVIESICTLLGHPRKCPHGRPIPEGDCCKRSASSVDASVVHLPDLSVGSTGRIAYVNCQDDAQLHRLNGLQIKPGVTVTLHQKYPSYVLESEGAMVALDERIADNICLWKQAEQPSEKTGGGPGKKEKRAWPWQRKGA